MIEAELDEHLGDVGRREQGEHGRIAGRERERLADTRRHGQRLVVGPSPVLVWFTKPLAVKAGEVCVCSALSEGV